MNLALLRPILKPSLSMLNLVFPSIIEQQTY